MSGKKSFHIKTASELANLPNCKHDSLGTCDKVPEKVSDCIRCLVLGIDLALCKENIGLAMNHLKTLQVVLEKNGWMGEKKNEV